MKSVYSLNYKGNDLQMNYPLRKAAYNGIIGIVLLLIGLPFIVVSANLVLTTIGSDDALSARFIEILLLFIGLILSAFGIAFLTCRRQLHFSASGISIRITGMFRFPLRSIPIDRIKGLHTEVYKEAKYPDMAQAGIDYIESYTLYVLTNKAPGRVFVFGRFDNKSEAEELKAQIEKILLLPKAPG